MAAVLERVSTITDKGQTTVPKPVRDALGVSYGGKIAFRVDEHGVSIRRADDENDDPVVGAFLSFLAEDMLRHPQAISGLNPALAKQVAQLIEGMNGDSAEDIEGDVAL